jgi:hypothetical protein
MTRLIGKSCQELVTEGGFTNQLQIPTPIKGLKGQTIKMHLQTPKTDRPGNTQFTVGRITAAETQHQIPPTPDQPEGPPTITNITPPTATSSRAKRSIHFGSG